MTIRPPKFERRPGGRVRVRIDLCEPCRLRLRELFERLGRQANALDALAVICKGCMAQLPPVLEEHAK